MLGSPSPRVRPLPAQKNLSPQNSAGLFSVRGAWETERMGAERNPVEVEVTRGRLLVYTCTEGERAREVVHAMQGMSAAFDGAYVVVLPPGATLVSLTDEELRKLGLQRVVEAAPGAGGTPPVSA